MSAYSIQKKIWKAGGKVAKKLAMHEYLIYRSSTLGDPICEANWIDTKKAAFAQDDKFSKPHEGGVSTWNCYIDGRLTGSFDLQQGDFLYDPEEEVTYFISAQQDIMQTRAIKTTSTISVARTGYADSVDGYGQTDIDVGINIPCWIGRAGGGGGLGYVPAASYAADTLPTYEIYCFDPANEIQRRDIITDEHGNRSQVISADRDDMGTVITAVAYNPE